jgi:AcrR family transcriptional regulator
MTAGKKAENPIRKKILSKARSLFGRKGYSETTIKDIAVAYGCEPANIYNYFESKEAILFEVLYEETQGLVSKIASLLHEQDSHPAEQIKTIFKVHGEVALGEMKPGKLMYDTELRKLTKQHQNKIITLRDQYDEILRSIIRRGIDLGVFKPVNVQIAAYAIASTLMRLRVWYHPKGPLRKNEIIMILWEYALGALGYEETEPKTNEIESRRRIENVKKSNKEE